MRDQHMTFLAELLAAGPPENPAPDRYSRRTPGAAWRTLTEDILPTWLPAGTDLTSATYRQRRQILRWNTAAALLIACTAVLLLPPFEGTWRAAAPAAAIACVLHAIPELQPTLARHADALVTVSLVGLAALRIVIDAGAPNEIIAAVRCAVILTGIVGFEGHGGAPAVIRSCRQSVARVRRWF